METERQLLEAIRGGDAQAMRRLYDRYSGYTMAIALRYIPEYEDARDVLQDSFVSILTSVKDFNYNGEGSLKSWISRIVTNRAVDWLKAQDEQQMTDEVPDEEDDEDEEVNPEIDDIPPEILNRMIGRLPARCRQVLNLYVFEQLSHKEIARRLNIGEGTSASQFFRAKKLLRTMIEDYIGNKGI